MGSPGRINDSDSNGESSITPTKKRRKQTKIPSYFSKLQSEQASRQSTATSELKSVDNEKLSSSREIFDDQELQSTDLKNLKRRYITNNEPNKNSKIQRLTPNYASQSLSRYEDSANTSSVRTSSVKSPQPKGNVEDIIRRSSLKHPKMYPSSKSGLKDTLHGDIFQLEHLMLAVIRARKMGYAFRLATEMDPAEKFDDLVLQFRDNKGNTVHRFVQIKHKQDETQSNSAKDLSAEEGSRGARKSQPIKASDLLADIKGPFSVKKYFNSWRKIIKHEDFKESKLKDFILLTNTGLDMEGLTKANIGLKKVEEADNFLKVEDRDEQPPRYKLLVNKSSELCDKLKTASDIDHLAQALAQCIRNSRKIDLNSKIFRRYHVALAQEVIDIQNKKLHVNFVNNNLSPTAKRFRDILLAQLLPKKVTSEKDKQECLDKCELKLSESFGKHSESANESEPNIITDLPNGDHIDHQEIIDFFDAFTLAVEQPDGVELDKMIKNGMGADPMFNLRDADLITDSFKKFILHWLQDKFGVFLENIDIGNFYDELKGKLRSFMTMGLTLEYSEMLEEYGIAFKNQNADLKKFLDSSGSIQEPILQLISSKDSLLTALRVHQTLKDMEKYNQTDSFIFMNLEKLLRPKIAETALLAFKNPRNHNLFVIDCELDIAKPDARELWIQLEETMGNNYNKRMLLIIQGNNDSALQFKTGWQISHEKDDDMSIDNLEQYSRQKLLQKKVIKFQGHEESFARLLSINNFDDVGVERWTEFSRIIKVDTLVKLIRDKDIVIGSEVKGLEEIEHYYIPRTIVPRGGGKDVILNEDEFAERNEQGKIVVLSDEAGMGKSTVLTHLAIKIKQKKPCTLVIRIDLTQNTGVLDKELRKRSFGNDDTNGAVDFLVDKLSSIQTDFESQVFKTLVKDQGNAVLLFDGFDEITPKYTVIMIDLLPALAKLPIKKLVLTTRSYAFKKLEEQAKRGSFLLALYNLQPFSVENQTEFLIKFWKRECRQNNSDEGTEECLQNHARNVIHLLSRSINDHMNVFTGIPLQTKLVAENFQYPFELPEKIDILDLYEGFVKKKYNLYREEKKCADPTKQAEITDLAVSYRIFLMTHQKFALETLFDKETAKMLLSSQPRLEICLDEFKNVIKGQECTGIITQVIEGKPYFIHQTFAEYFAAEFLFKTLKDDCRDQDVHGIFLKTVFFNSEYYTVRSFLNCLLWDVSNVSKKERWQEISRGDIPSFVRTVYHINAEEGNVAIIKFLVNCLCPTSLDIKDFDGRTPLFYAVEGKKNLGMVKYLMDNGADINSLDKDGRTVLHDAAFAGDNLDVVEYLLKNGADINSPDKDGRTVLYTAVCAFKNLDVVEFLVKKGAHINALDKDGRTVLYAAVCAFENLDVVEFLVKKGAHINALDKDGRTVLHDAARVAGNVDVAKYLLENGADINSLNKNGRTVLHHTALAGNNLHMMEFLVKKGAHINALDKDGRTVLHDAARAGNHLDVVKYLLENGADINSFDKNGRTVLHDAACAFKNLDVVEFLVKKGAHINALDKDGRTVLHDAARAGNHLDVVKYLLENGVDINSFDKNGRTVLHDAACAFKNLDVVEFLVKKGAHINSLDNNGRTVLHNAVRDEADLDVIHYLLENGADINALDKDGRTVLHDAAVAWANLNVVKYLLENGADINALDTDGRTVLHDAAEGGADLDAINYLLENGADINALDTDGRTVLHDAARGGADLDVINYLLENGADINALDKDGRTVLHDAARAGNHLDVVKYLLKNGADINSFDKNGRTVLHDAACAFKNLDVVEFLVKKGAHINALDKDGRTVLHDAALAGNNLDVVEFLVKKGAHINALDEDGRTVLHDATGAFINLDVVEFL